mgnify:CR=1 FL=1
MPIGCNVVGWVPNVAGSLIYDLVNKRTDFELADFISLYSPGNYTKDTNSKTFHNPRREQVMHTALLDVNDLNPLKNKLNRYVRLVIVAERVEGSSLKGQIYEISTTNMLEQHDAGFKNGVHTKILEAFQEVERRYKKETSSEIFTKLSNRKNKPTLDLYLIQNIFNQIEQGYDKGNKQKVFKAIQGDFLLKRNGMVYIGNMQPIFLDERGVYASTHILNEHQKAIMGDEFYIRIKQLFHKHRHHAVTEDNILYSTQYSSKVEELTISFEKLSRDLKRSIIHRRRALKGVYATETGLTELQGMCTYGKSFVNIAIEELKIFGADNSHKVFSFKEKVSDFENISESVEMDKNRSAFFSFIGRPPQNIFILYRLLVLAIPMAIVANLFGYKFCWQESYWVFVAIAFIVNEAYNHIHEVPGVLVGFSSLLTVGFKKAFNVQFGQVTNSSKIKILTFFAYEKIRKLERYHNNKITSSYIARCVLDFILLLMGGVLIVIVQKVYEALQ